MFDKLFSGAFDAGIAFSQISALIIGAALSLLGAALLYDWLRWKFFATRIVATIKGLQKKGNSYHPVFQYIDGNGQEQEARSNMGASYYRDMKEGDVEEILIFPDRPFQARATSGFAESVIGLLLLLPGLFILKIGFTSYPVTPLTGMVAIGMAVYFGVKIKRGLKPKAEWDTRESFRSRMDQKAKDQLEKTPFVTKAEIESDERQEINSSRIGGPVMAVLSVVLIAGGLYLGEELGQLTALGIRTKGEVIRLDHERGFDTASSGTYHPVVHFKDMVGQGVIFKDGVGSNPPAYRKGEEVSILYSPEKPEKSAQIDRGIWSWILPFGLVLAGIFALWGAIYNFRLMKKGELR